MPIEMKEVEEETACGCEVTTPECAEVERESVIVPRYEIVESATDYTLRLEMPGVRKETLEINVDRDTLVIEGKREGPGKGLTPLVQERPVGIYQRVFQMDNTVEWEKVSARAESGVVVITIPKASHPQPRRIRVS